MSIRSSWPTLSDNQLRNLGLLALAFIPLSGCGKLDSQRNTASLKHGLPFQQLNEKASRVAHQDSPASAKSNSPRANPQSDIPPAWRAPQWTPPKQPSKNQNANEPRKSDPKPSSPDPKAKSKNNPSKQPSKGQPAQPQKSGQAANPKPLPQRPVPMGPMPKSSVPLPPRRPAPVASTPQQPKSPQPTQRPPKPQPAPQPEPSGAAFAPPAWGTSGKYKSWTAAVQSVVRSRLRDFDSAQDAGLFCPGYQNASPAERVNCWVLLVSAVSKFESEFKVDNYFLEASGHYSIGLLALSPGECPNALTSESLTNPIQNLLCGVNMMAKLIVQDGYIDGPKAQRGASKYWSTLRSQYKSYDRSRKQVFTLGHKNEVMAFAKHYRDRVGARGLVKQASWENSEEDSSQGIRPQEISSLEDSPSATLIETSWEGLAVQPQETTLEN